MRHFTAIAVFCLCLSAPAWAEGPSFDCGKAASPVEKAICASGDLSTLDRQIAEEYPAAVSIGQTNVAEQRAWLAQRDRVCAPANTTDCLRRVLMDRHAFLISKPEGYHPAVFRGQPGFDCDTAETENEILICGHQELSEIHLALMKAYDTAEQEGFRLAVPGARSYWRKEACGRRNAADDFPYIIMCLKEDMRYELRDLAWRAAYEERVPTARSKYTGEVTYHDGFIRKVLTIASARGMAPHIAAINADKEFRKTNGKVRNCTAMAAVSHRGTQPEEYLDFAYGGLCTVDRDGSAHRELVCIETYGPYIHEMAVDDRLIGQKEIAIFTALNCD